MGTIINTASECSIKKFMDCCFNEKYKVLLTEGEATDEELKTAFEYIYAEYVDYSGLYTTREFELSAYIQSLDIRIQTIKRFLELQREFIYQFNCPFQPGFALVKKYGHKLYWDFERPDKESFLNKLLQIEMKEKRYEVEIENKIKDLVDLRRKKVKKEFTLLEGRKEFISMLNRLQQQHFVIDKNLTTVEDLAIMIKDQREQAETNRALQKFKK